MSASTIDAASERDAEQLLAVSASVRWAHTLDDWHGILESALVFVHRAPDGAIVGTGAVFPFPPDLAAIGMIIVRPEHQGRGLARAMMRRCMASMGTLAPSFLLIATPQGRPLYEQLGFEVVDHILRMTRARSVDASPTDGDVVTLAAGDADAVYRLDAEAFGADRRRALGPRIARRRRGALLRRRGVVVGYGLSDGGCAAISVGPIVAPDPDGAVAVVRHLAEGESAVRLDVPAEQSQLLSALDALGFERGDAAPIMRLGGRGLPGNRERLFATASRAIC